MAFLPASRTKRRLFKIASLGLAGLLAGLLSGCTDSPDTVVSTPYAHVSSYSLNNADANADAEAQPATLPRSLDETQIPALRHPPTSRSLQYGTVHTASMTSVPTTSNRS